MSEVEKHTYSEGLARHLSCDRFEELRRGGKFIDVEITTKGGNVVSAHRLILAARIPLFETIMKDEARRSLGWDRFTEDVVEAVVVYAYTGCIDITTDNAIRLFLLATNLECSTVVSWCVDFLRPRMTLETLSLTWSIANATMNNDLIDICIPVIAEHFANVGVDKAFSCVTESEYLAALLMDSRLKDVSGDAKVHAISSWLDGWATEEERDARIGCFVELLSKIDLGTVSSDFFVDLCVSDCALNRLDDCRKHLVFAWKEARKQAPAAPNTEPAAPNTEPEAPNTEPAAPNAETAAAS